MPVGSNKAPTNTNKKIRAGEGLLDCKNAKGKATTEMQLNKSASTLSGQAPNLSMALPPKKAAITIGMILPALAIPVTKGDCVYCNTKRGIATAATWLPNKDKNSAHTKPSIGILAILTFIAFTWVNNCFLKLFYLKQEKQISY